LVIAFATTRLPSDGLICADFVVFSFARPLLLLVFLKNCSFPPLADTLIIVEGFLVPGFRQLFGNLRFCCIALVSCCYFGYPSMPRFISGIFLPVLTNVYSPSLSFRVY